MDFNDQIRELATPVHPRFIRTHNAVKGPYTTGDYVRWQLNRIFGPSNWSFTLTDGPRMVTVNESASYVQCSGRLVVQFADGNQSTHDDVGVWPLSAGKDKKLDETAPERYETVLKAAVTDGSRRALSNWASVSAC